MCYSLGHNFYFHKRVNKIYVSKNKACGQAIENTSDTLDDQTDLALPEYDKACSGGLPLQFLLHLNTPFIIAILVSLVSPMTNEVTGH